MVLVGPSGCGKTTALRMVAGLEEITAGEIRIGDRVVNDVDPRRRDVAMVFQNYALYPHMTVFDNIAFGLRARRAPKAEIKAPRRERGQALGLGEPARAQAAPALRRSAPARRDGARDRARAAGLPDGRAAVEPRRAPARADARGGRARPARARRDDDLRHARPGRGDDDGRPRRRHARRRAPADAAIRRRCSTGPSNLFVASFIGSPPMNLVQARLEEPRRRTRRRASASRSSQSRPSVVAARPGLRRVRRPRGRPRHPARSTSASATGDEPRARLRGTVRATEALGSELLVHLDVDAEPVLTEEVREVAGDVDAAALERLESEALRAPDGADRAPRDAVRARRRRADRGGRRHAAAPLLRPRQRARDLRLDEGSHRR